MHTGLAVLRVGIGIMFLVHGWPKLSGGIDTWQGLGSAMSYLGITFAPAFWGFCAAVAEFVGGLALIAGIGVRVAAGFMCITMLVAAIKHLAAGDGIMGASHAIELTIVFVFFVITGAGRYGLQQFLFTPGKERQL
jgi:putative oxidoreductase